MDPSKRLSLSTRNRLPELMDQPGLDPVEHAAALRGLRRINSWSRSTAILFPWIRRCALEHGGRPLRVLDLACGGGDTVVALAGKARREGLPIQVDGCDISPQAVEHSRNQAEAAGVDARFFVHDALHGDLPSGYDVIMCSLFLHHLDEGDAQGVLGRMKSAARRLVLVDDLVRSRLGYTLAWVGCRLLSRSKVVHYDGPVSVAGAFRADEVASLAAQAGLDGAVVTRHWPERYLLSWISV